MLMVLALVLSVDSVRTPPQPTQQVVARSKLTANAGLQLFKMIIMRRWLIHKHTESDDIWAHKDNDNWMQKLTTLSQSFLFSTLAWLNFSFHYLCPIFRRTAWTVSLIDSWRLPVIWVVTMNGQSIISVWLLVVWMIQLRLMGIVRLRNIRLNRPSIYTDFLFNSARSST